MYFGGPTRVDREAGAELGARGDERKSWGAVKRYKHTKIQERGTSEGKVARATRSACGGVRGGAGAVEMSAKNISLIDGTGGSIGESLFCACAMRPFVSEEPAKKHFLTRAR
jgi:hypothetical protein